jgi:hypothetical protein
VFRIGGDRAVCDDSVVSSLARFVRDDLASDVGVWEQDLQAAHTVVCEIA